MLLVPDVFEGWKIFFIEYFFIHRRMSVDGAYDGIWSFWINKFNKDGLNFFLFIDFGRNV